MHSKFFFIFLFLTILKACPTAEDKIIRAESSQIEPVQRVNLSSIDYKLFSEVLSDYFINKNYNEVRETEILLISDSTENKYSCMIPIDHKLLNILDSSILIELTSKSCLLNKNKVFINNNMIKVKNKIVDTVLVNTDNENSESSNNKNVTVVQLSNPVIIHDKYAYVYIGFLFGSNSGLGTHFFLKHEDGKWNTIWEHIAWLR